MNVTIRKATLEDVNTISEIYALSWKAAYKEIVLQNYLDELETTFWVEPFKSRINNNMITAQLICENDLPVGCISYGRARDSKYSSFGEIFAFYLLPSHFRKGYGKKLLQAAIEDIKMQGYRDCYLWALKDNKNARAFYEKNGFVCNNDEYIIEIMQKRLVNLRYLRCLGDF